MEFSTTSRGKLFHGLIDTARIFSWCSAFSGFPLFSLISLLPVIPHQSVLSTQPSLLCLHLHSWIQLSLEKSSRLDYILFTFSNAEIKKYEQKMVQVSLKGCFQDSAYFHSLNPAETCPRFLGYSDSWPHTNIPPFLPVSELRERVIQGGSNACGKSKSGCYNNRMQKLKSCKKMCLVEWH